MFSRGEVVASLMAANAVSKMLAPKNPKIFYDSSGSAEMEENVLKNYTVEVASGHSSCECSHPHESSNGDIGE